MRNISAAVIQAKNYVHFSWSAIVIYKTALFLTHELQIIITLCCDWSFHMPDGYITGWSGMSYCNQAPFPPLEGWGLGTGLGISSLFRTWKIWSGDETSQAFHSGDKIRNRKPGFEAKVHWSTMLLHPLFYLFDAWCLYSLGTRPSENQSLTLTVLSV